MQLQLSLPPSAAERLELQELRLLWRLRTLRGVPRQPQMQSRKCLRLLTHAQLNQDVARHTREVSTLNDASGDARWALGSTLSGWHISFLRQQHHHQIAARRLPIEVLVASLPRRHQQTTNRSSTQGEVYTQVGLTEA